MMFRALLILVDGPPEVRDLDLDAEADILGEVQRTGSDLFSPGLPVVGAWIDLRRKAANLTQLVVHQPSKGNPRNETATRVANWFHAISGDDPPMTGNVLIVGSTDQWLPAHVADEVVEATTMIHDQVNGRWPT